MILAPNYGAVLDMWFSGYDNYVYSVCDDGYPIPGLCDTATVSITVTGMPCASINVKVFLQALMRVSDRNKHLTLFILLMRILAIL